MNLEERRKLLVDLLADPDESVAAAAAAVIEQLESFQDLQQIVANLQSDKRGVRVKAIYATEWINSPVITSYSIHYTKLYDLRASTATPVAACIATGWQLPRSRLQKRPVQHRRPKMKTGKPCSQPSTALRPRTMTWTLVITSYSIHYTKLYDNHQRSWTGR